MNLSTADRSTIAKLLGLVGSEHDGEALSAARKAHQLVRSRQATWADALGLEASPPEPAHLAVARELLRTGKGIITPWEARFLRGVLGFKTLSDHQRQTLDGIKEKVEASAADMDFHPPTD